jgi:hypothetical protein
LVSPIQKTPGGGGGGAGVACEVEVS